MSDMKSSRAARLLVKYLIIVFGSVIYAVGFQFFLYPNSITSGGVVGIAMIINQLSGLPVGVLTILLNIPLFLVAWRHFGLDFLVGSLVGMGLSSVLVDLFAVFGIRATSDPMLAAVIGGVIKGFGLGVIYYVGATTGGIDIVVKLLRTRFMQLNFGTIMLILDAAIILAYALIIKNYDSAMYSVITMFVVTKVIDLVLYGLDMSCVCHIISEKSEELIRELTSGHVHRGVTILEGEGAYSRKQKHVILCVIKRSQIPELRRTIRDLDENAFVIITDAKNVFGRGFENIAEVR